MRPSVGQVPVVPEPESVFRARLSNILRHNPNCSRIMLERRGTGAIHLGVDGVMPMRHLTEYDDQYSTTVNRGRPKRATMSFEAGRTRRPRRSIARTQLSPKT